jgi:hypothetical protein
MVVHAPTIGGGTYTLTPVPYSAQEGNSIDLILSATGVTPGIQYEFIFHVEDPSSTIWRSSQQDITPSGSSFTVLLVYPSSSLPGTNALVGQYNAWVNQTMPISPLTDVASSHFLILLTDRSEYQRTNTVSIVGTSYTPNDSVSVTIVRQTTSTVVFSQTVTATPSGIVATTWTIPKNATIDNYSVSLIGTSTPAKNPADIQTFSINAAVISIASLSTSKSTYERTETMTFSFQPVYPSGEIATTGAGVITLTGPSGKGVTLTASTFDSAAQSFSVTYTTFKDNQTGTWTASIRAGGYGDGYGNYGPTLPVSTSPQLQPATLSVTVTTNSNLTPGQAVRLNTTIQYPDGTTLQSGQVTAFFTYIAGGHNDSIPIAFDSTLQLWVGSYTPQASEPSGLWSLTVKASDSLATSPPNSGTASRVVTLQANSSPATVPLYYFGILAALIAAAAFGFFLAFRRRRVTHARLKIDLEAVKSEAGKIEDQDFFKSIKDQLNKDEERSGNT